MTSDVLGRVARRLAKLGRRGKTAAVTPWLERLSARSHRALVDPSNDVVVCLTSYGPRLNTVHITIESIGRGRVRPRRLILWTDPGVDEDSLPNTLTHLRQRGLEILPSAHLLGPHTKYFPYVASLDQHSIPLVTADDDTLYPRRWLERLQSAAARHPGEIVCFRAHRVALRSDGTLAPYNNWTTVVGTNASLLHFATGVSGVHYPAKFLTELKVDGDRFLSLCPRADDVWLHYRAVAHGRPVRQITRHPRKYPEVAATQGSALHLTNTGQNANDTQIEATYDSAALAVLLSERRSR